jgi:hypothetical protein
MALKLYIWLLHNLDNVLVVWLGLIKKYKHPCKQGEGGHPVRGHLSRADAQQSTAQVCLRVSQRNVRSDAACAVSAHSFKFPHDVPAPDRHPSGQDLRAW